MIELIQFPWSPFCIVQRQILKYAGVPFKTTNIPPNDRSSVWKLTRQRYYGVPVLRDGSKVMFETDANSQVLAKYLDFKLKLGLFPANIEGVQSLIWRYIENDVEEMCFKLNDSYYRKFVPKSEQLAYLRHKERKFGPGCLDQWANDRKSLEAELSRRLLPFEEMLSDKPFLLGDAPRFLDFDLLGMLGNFLHSGQYKLPPEHLRLKHWHQAIEKLTIHTLNREKLRT
jgi:glutathione S-transferase